MSRGAKVFLLVCVGLVAVMVWYYGRPSAPEAADQALNESVKNPAADTAKDRLPQKPMDPLVDAVPGQPNRMAWQDESQQVQEPVNAQAEAAASVMQLPAMVVEMGKPTELPALTWGASRASDIPSSPAETSDTREQSPAQAIPAVVQPIAPRAVNAPARATPERSSHEPRAMASTTYTVASGDTLSSIAAALLGDAKNWQLIVDVNPGINPNRLQIGQVLKIPSRESARSQMTQPAPPISRDPGGTVVHEVRAGDTLSSLSRRYYGFDSMWRKIFEANRKLLADENSLEVGMKLVIPPRKD